MKLLFAIKKLATVGGAERVLSTLCSELVARGHQVSILTFDTQGAKLFYPLDNRVNRIDLGIGDASRPARLSTSWKQIKALRQIARAQQPDVAIGFMHSMFIPLAVALVGTRIPILGSEHRTSEQYQTRPLQYLLFMLVAPLLDRLTVLSEAIRSRYSYVIKRRMVAIANPVEVTIDATKAVCKESQLTLLSVGRLVRVKDHSTLIKAFALIADEFHQWHLKIIGEGVLRSELEELIKSVGLENRISMPGITSEIGIEYASAEAFVLPSNYESFGLAMAEAMSYGLPVIGFTDCPGSKELIETNETGILVDPNNDRVASLANTLLELMSNPSLRQKLGVKGQEAIRKHFSTSHVCDQWENLLVTLSKRG